MREKFRLKAEKNIQEGGLDNNCELHLADYEASREDSYLIVF